MSERVETRDGEAVFLAESVSVPMGAAAYAALEGAPATSAAIIGILASVFLAPAPYGAIEGWTYTEDEEPVPVTGENIARLLTWNDGGKEVAERAADLYSEELFRPLVALRSKSSPAGPTVVTSASGHSGPTKKRAKGSKRSSPTATAGPPSVAVVP